MKSKGNLIISIIQLALGLLAIFSLVIVLANGESILTWLMTAVLAAAFVILGIAGIVNYSSKK